MTKEINIKSVILVVVALIVTAVASHLVTKESLTGPQIPQDIVDYQRALEERVESLKDSIERKNGIIDSIEIELAKDSVIIVTKIIERNEEINVINSASDSDNYWWLTNRYQVR